jgi:hypothetical protein
LAPALDGQEGAGQVVFAGPLAGKTIITRHSVRAGDRKNDYVVILGNLGDVNALAPKTPIEGLTPIGTVGSAPVYLECRLLRPGVDPFAVPSEQLLEESTTVAVDPRNVLRPSG